MNKNYRLSRTKKPTLADVAKLAGVSLGSASRALSVPEQVKPITLEKVNQAVAQLGYIRDGSARALASRRTHTIAAVYPTLNNPIFAQSTHSMQQALWDRGYQLLIASHEYHTQDELPIVRATLERGVDGIIMVGTDHSEEVFSILSQLNMPYVLTWSVDDSHYPYCVGISNFDASYELAQYVLKHGHKRIAICGGPIENNERSRGRRNGILTAAAHAGIEVPEKWITVQPFSYKGGRQGLRELWALEDRPSVLFCGTDLQAIGALYECQMLGIRVPEDLSIVGFDGMEEATMVHPKLTTIRIPAHDIGSRAALLMLELLAGNTPPKERPIKTEIVPGESLGKV